MKLKEVQIRITHLITNKKFPSKERQIILHLMKRFNHQFKLKKPILN
jgi:hypothetical protein